ncbi:MAG: DUF2314 domain-containing protein, partial [Planctomycetales bacterium]|nr:DUF2314 domain-containing protein [Planctomycetales bacterium]
TPQRVLGEVSESAHSWGLERASDDENAPRGEGAIFYNARILTDIASTYPPPDKQTLRFFGRGLTAEQGERLQRAQSALVLEFEVPQASRKQGLDGAYRLILAAAQLADGLVWDDATREVFAPSAWEQKRLAGWDEENPRCANHVTMHMYPDETGLRIVSLGMKKFGLPDVVVEGVARSDAKAAAMMANVVLQMWVENPASAAVGDCDLDLRQLRHRQIRSRPDEANGDQKKGVAKLTFERVAADEGDPDNELLIVGFERNEGPDRSSRLTRALADLWGWQSHDRVETADHDDGELHAARRRAKEKLPLLRGKMERGLAPGEVLMVKAPFKATDGSNEWMWVEVAQWQGDRIRGALRNEPEDVPQLRIGQQVEVSMGDVFDYLYRRADGVVEGNETGAIISRQNAAN